jgi:hypothetical protein
VTTCGDAGGKNAQGAPCRAVMRLSASNGLCLMHDPERTEELKAMRSAAGVASKESKRRAKAALPADVPKAPKTLEDAVQFASWLTWAVCVGALDARTAHESAYALNCFKAAVEKRDLQREIEKLRAELAATKTNQHRPRLA